MRGRFPAVLLAKYPHMAPADVEVWEQYLKFHRAEWDSFDYDVRVGKGVDPGPAFPANIRRDAMMLTQKRIDVVGYRGEETWIIEVKPRAGLGAVGQLVGYKTLYEQEHGQGSVTGLLLVCQVADDDVKEAARAAGIQVVETKVGTELAPQLPVRGPLEIG